MRQPSKSPIYQGFSALLIEEVRPQGCTSRTAVLQALNFCLQDFATSSYNRLGALLPGRFLIGRQQSRHPYGCRLFALPGAWLSVWVFPQASDSDGEHGSARGKADERYRGEEADFPVKKQDERESKPENTVNHQHQRDMAALPQDFCMVNAAHHEQKGGGQADQAEAGGVVGISKREQYAADQRAEHKEHENLWLKQTMKHDSIPPG